MSGEMFKSSAVLGAFAKFRKATGSFVLYVYPSALPPAWNNSASTRRIIRKYWSFIILLNCVNLTVKTGT